VEPDPLRNARRDCRGTITNDSLSYATSFSQAGQAIRSRTELLGGIAAAHVAGRGRVAIAQRLTLYYNSIQPLHHVYDGYLLHILAGHSAPTSGPSCCGSIRERDRGAQPGGDSSAGLEHLSLLGDRGASHVGYWFMMYRMAARRP
jgi:hypothetical protein